MRYTLKIEDVILMKTENQESIITYLLKFLNRCGEKIKIEVELGE